MTAASRMIAAESGFDLLFGIARTRWARLASARPLTRRRVAVIGLLALAGWLSTGLYKVAPDEMGVVLRFGRRFAVTGPGLHVHLPYPFDRILIRSVTRLNELAIGRSSNGPSRPAAMLTGDENIVEADVSVLWRIHDLQAFLFDVADPDHALRVAAESAVREVVGRSPIQSAISDGRAAIADAIRSSLQTTLDRDGSGIEIAQVQLQRVDPPATVIDAFNDLQRARSDAERARNEAEAFKNEILPRARAEAARINAEARAYRQQVASLADGDARSFRAVYEAYRAAPETTSWRLYLDSLDDVLRRASRVVIDGTARDKGTGAVSVLQLLDERAKVTAPKPDAAPKAGTP